MKLLNLIIFLLIASSLLSQNAEEYIELSRQKQAEGNYNYALNLTEKAIEQDSTELLYRLYKSEILLDLDRVEDAAIELYKTLAMDTTYAETYNRLGTLYLSMGYLDASLGMYDYAITYSMVDSLSFGYFINRASAKGMLRDFESSIADLESAYEINDTSLVLLNNLAAIHSEIGNSRQAIRYCREVIDIDSTFIGAYVNLGLIYTEIDSLEQGAYYFTKGLEIDANEPLIYSNRGFLYYKQKEYGKALEDLNKSIDMYPSNPFVYKNRALVYFALGHQKEGCRDLDIAEYYKFEEWYGDEVAKLKVEHCENIETKKE
ncbi:MAG: tetratricopeptide repeat protein [Bacteroidota bacterium]